MWLIVGLGNPGEQYARTRHNIGFECVERLAARHGLQFNKKRAQADIAEGTIGGQRVVLARPFTFMNLSGRSVVGLKGWYKINPAEALLVIYDDLDLPFGKLRLRQRGSAGTHNGMRSIVNLMGSQDFPRLRVGIDKPPPRWDTAAYVLGRFSTEQQEELPFIYEQVADAVELVVREGFTAAMNKYNIS
ncbi:MAG: aminoacyl-tRNA hydrolase [Chloroflexaceae bacterium]|nr:aminoacyl-tRNA hydrolase [Chloroflexaceae bacterium]NJL34858.1 aminoacyl-tRNA hydrolase [Chloroflexaceae bacterium]NJO04516.1 aminoacyl-tRNA hydrolase [Chloroflexaceae bacterium]